MPKAPTRNSGNNAGPTHSGEPFIRVAKSAVAASQLGRLQPDALTPRNWFAASQVSRRQAAVSPFASWAARQLGRRQPARPPPFSHRAVCVCLKPEGTEHLRCDATSGGPPSRSHNNPDPSCVCGWRHIQVRTRACECTSSAMGHRSPNRAEVGMRAKSGRIVLNKPMFVHTPTCNDNPPASPDQWVQPPNIRRERVFPSRQPVWESIWSLATGVE